MRLRRRLRASPCPNRYVGRAVAALAADPDRARWNQQSDCGMSSTSEDRLVRQPNSVAELVARGDGLTSISWARASLMVEVLAAHAGGRRVLDLGCLGHRRNGGNVVSRSHRDLSRVAEVCVGADFDAVRVREACASGWDVRVADIERSALDRFDAAGNFDCVTALDVVEHLGNPGRLFEIADHVLGAGGRLVVSTPNPYSPWRFVKGVRQHVWESVDHTLYCFPSGMYELGRRSGLVLSAASVIDYGRSWRSTFVESIKDSLRHNRRRWARAAYEPYVIPGVWRALLAVPPSRFWLCGETVVYVFEKREEITEVRVDTAANATTC